MFNHGTNDYVVKKGARCAQMIIEKCALPEIEVVKETSYTTRMEAGFGSSDVKQEITQARITLDK